MATVGVVAVFRGPQGSLGVWTIASWTSGAHRHVRRCLAPYWGDGVSHSFTLFPGGSSVNNRARRVTPEGRPVLSYNSAFLVYEYLEIKLHNI